MIVRAPSWVSVSMMTLRLGSSFLTRKIWLPPMPSSGLRITSPSSSMKAWISTASRATSEVAMNCGNSVIASFSEWSRIARGLLNTRAPAWAASSSSQVAVTYSKSKGGSWRISTASKAASACDCSGPVAAYHGASPASRWICRARALTAPSRQVSAARCVVHTSCPRAAAARIIAMLESL